MTNAMGLFYPFRLNSVASSLQREIPMKTHARFLCLIAAACLITSGLTLAGDNWSEQDWVKESNANTMIVMEAQAKFSPESFASLGIEKYDEEIIDLNADIYQRSQAHTRELIAQMQERLKTTENPKVIQDLHILIKSLQDQFETEELDHRYMLPYFNLSQSLFYGFRSLLDPRVDPARYPAALERLRKYTGKAEGYTPLTELAMARTQEGFAEPGLAGPYKGELEKDLDNVQRYSAGLEKLFVDSGLEDWEQDLAILQSQLNDYAAWLKKEMTPRSRTDHRLPEAIYADNLKNFGVDMDPQDLIRAAQLGFGEIRNEMRTIASLIAKEQGLPSTDYRDVIRELKKDQIPEDALMTVYRQRLRDIEKIITDNRIISLPERDAVIRMATEAESSAVPAPFLSPPQLIGNTGQPAEFVLVTTNPTAQEGEAKMDDWGHGGMTWSLTVHEARPGHELQFASMIESGVSQARGIYAFNSANVEGWALYAEAVMKEYLPLEGQLFTLQARMMRAARAFLDPMLNLGLIDTEQALSFILNDVVISEPMARSEIDRYTFRAPGQATSYYYGYMNMMSLRTEVELILRDRFDQLRFHDFVLAQGLLPPEILRQAVLDEFVPAEAMTTAP
jgi:uncharacterized protein (DUF885 family)